MNSMKLLITLIILMLFISPSTVDAKKKKSDKSVYKFKIEKVLKAVSVKSQGRTGTCWSFATVSFLESEVLRKTGIKDIDLSEMYIVRNVYPRKAQNFVRLHGKANFSSGGQAHDVTEQIRLSGMVPESVFSGMKMGEKKHNHGEVATVLDGFVNGIIKRRRGMELTPRWMKAFNAILDVYLGSEISEFEYDKKKYTPKGFVSNYLKLDMSDYIELTSCTNVPFFTKFRQLVPDNWSSDANYYNLPLNTLEKIVDDSIKKGYTVCWDADVSDRYFNFDRKGCAVVPEKDYDDLTKKEQKAKIKQPVKEKKITQELRQKHYDNYSTTDDHLMHLIGIVRDQNGKKFYLIKNSWGTDSKYKGYYYISSAYFRLRTINIMINKEVLSEELKNKLNL